MSNNIAKRVIEVPINLSILDFKFANCIFKWGGRAAINLSILDFKLNRKEQGHFRDVPINLSILDFKYG